MYTGPCYADVWKTLSWLNTVHLTDFNTFPSFHLGYLKRKQKPKRRNESKPSKQIHAPESEKIKKENRVEDIKVYIPQQRDILVVYIYFFSFYFWEKQVQMRWTIIFSSLSRFDEQMKWSMDTFIEPNK